MLSILLLMAALWRLWHGGGNWRDSGPLIFLVGLAAVLVCVLQLLPLPFGWWRDVARLSSIHSGGGAGQTAAWYAYSLTPQATWAAAASLIVPVAVFAAAVQLDFKQRMALCWLLLALGALSLGLGFTQMAQGPQSALRFYETTNPSEAVGFFANRNHFAALLYVTLVLAAVWFTMTAGAFLLPGAQNTRAILWFAVAAAFLVAAVAGLAMARSRAGVFLAMAALAGIVFMALGWRRPKWAGRVQRHLNVSRVSMAAVAFAVLFAAQFGLGSVLSRFETDPLEDLRIPLNRTTFETALSALPSGTGLGSFVPVYAAAEKLDDAFSGYANRAHDDFAELLLETGVPGALLLLGFLAWFIVRFHRVWRAPPPEQRNTQTLIERAAALVVLLLLVHSLVDYPLRTTALGTLFAFFCAILAAPVPAADVASAPPDRYSRRRRRPARVPVVKWVFGGACPEGRLGGDVIRSR